MKLLESQNCRPELRSFGLISIFSLALCVSIASAQLQNLCSKDICSPGSQNFIRTVGADGAEYHYLRNGKIVSKSFKPTVDVGGVFMSSTLKMWVAGTNGKVFSKAPNERQWKEHFVGVDGTFDLIRCLDDRVCWVAGPNGKPWKTTDGGQHWIKVKSLPDTVETYADIIFVTQKVGWVFEQGGRIYRTNDGGTTWSLSELEYGGGTWNDIKDAVFLDQRTGFVCGHGGVAKTVDGGRTWKPILSETAGGSYSFSRIGTSYDGMKIWVFGGLGYFHETVGSSVSLLGKTYPNYYSDDGGFSWRENDRVF